MLGDDMLVFSTYNMPLSLPANRFVKRTFDIVFALVSLVITLPFYPIIALIIKISSPGPVLFKQRRTGINGKEFTILKFRSMHVNADADKVQATKNDPRKFVFGDFMRKTDIDELPQFINVLKGEMSIVGPRPHMLIHTKLYSSLIRKYMVRHFVKPGITGWAQVTGFRGETKDLDLMKKRVRQDIWYLEHWSFWLDLYIIFLTIKSVFVRDKHAY
jgi:putative colanic acid biosynthesis UDP-glucose lipid carrier transferase